MMLCEILLFESVVALLSCWLWSDGINLTKDVENISGKVGDWVDFLGGFKVYPVLQVRFTKTIF